MIAPNPETLARAKQVFPVLKLTLRRPPQVKALCEILGEEYRGLGNLPRHQAFRSSAAANMVLQEYIELCGESAL